MADTVLDRELREILKNIAESLFPLAEWIEVKDKRYPHLVNLNLPWRASGKALTVKDTGAISFFEKLLTESSDEVAFLERWQKILEAANPLDLSPIENLAAWRATRTPPLEVNPSFGIVASENILVQKDPEEKPSSRVRFYADYWELLKTTVALRNPSDPSVWKQLTQELFTDTCQEWNDQNKPLKSSLFMKQFASDLLYGMMGMKNSTDSEYQVALLIELAEYRRVGNQYTPAEVDRAREALRQKLS
jgi:hypothetical protein